VPQFGLSGAQVLPARGDPALRVLFCGINPAPSVAVQGLCFAGAGNRFWSVLHCSGFTPRAMQACEQDLLPGLGIGITALVARPTSRADEVTVEELRAGVPGLIRTVGRVGGCWVGFLGISAFRLAFDRPRAAFGPQNVDGMRVWLLPNPSGRNRSWSFDRLCAEYRRFHTEAVPS
jgi:TDG/mug DNA glycosylase family protein